jgi:hypothetical protein
VDMFCKFPTRTVSVCCIKWSYFVAILEFCESVLQLCSVDERHICGMESHYQIFYKSK